VNISVHFRLYLPHFFLESEMFRTNLSKNMKHNSVFSSLSPPLENRVFNEIIWKNVEPERPQMTIWRMRIACWITKDTNTHTHSEYVMLIFSTAAMVARTQLGTLHIHCLSCYTLRFLVSVRFLSRRNVPHQAGRLLPSVGLAPPVEKQWFRHIMSMYCESYCKYMSTQCG
jgi:hypothetical protein